MNAFIKSLTATFFLFVVINYAHADYALLGSESNINFISIKKDKVAEIHRFEQISGKVDSSGAIKIEIKLASVNTGIAIRDERMKSMLFESDLFPQAVITGKIDMSELKGLIPGDVFSQSLNLSLALHGESKNIDAEIVVVALKDGKVLVSTRKPIIIAADDYGLVGGVEKLRMVANLPSISTIVPVTFNLVFSGM